MPKAKDVLYIVIHCTAGFGSPESVQRYWKEKLKWKSPGYHRLIDVDGKVHKLAPFDQITNGVKSYNEESIHISYIGGIDKNNPNKAIDTRTEAQKAAILDCIYEAIVWLKENGKDVSRDLMILGHRDFSKDKNGNGIIDPFERIKECPSFNAIPEYNWITYNEYNKKNRLPNS